MGGREERGGRERVGRTEEAVKEGGRAGTNEGERVEMRETISTRRQKEREGKETHLPRRKLHPD